MPWRSPEISGLRQKTPGFLISASAGMAPVKGDWICVSDLAGAAERLTAVEGGILLTTGSKELAPLPCPGLRDRCFSTGTAQPGLSGALSGAGVFARACSVYAGALFQGAEPGDYPPVWDWGACDQGVGGAGGFWDKEEAAREAGCALVVVERPCQETGRSLEELKTDFKEALR